MGLEGASADELNNTHLNSAYARDKDGPIGEYFPWSQWVVRKAVTSGSFLRPSLIYILGGVWNMWVKFCELT